MCVCVSGGALPPQPKTGWSEGQRPPAKNILKKPENEKPENECNWAAKARAAQKSAQAKATQQIRSAQSDVARAGAVLKAKEARIAEQMHAKAEATKAR